MSRHTETQLVRCYPSGFRVDSSNFNPLHLWIYGIQYVLDIFILFFIFYLNIFRLAATNYQTLGK